MTNETEQAEQEHIESTQPASKKRRLPRLLARLVMLYVLYATVVFLAQDYLIFPSYLTDEPFANEKYDHTTTVLTRTIDDGKVIGWFIPARNASADQPAPLVMYFHGNAELIDNQADRIEGHRKNGCSVLICEYRDYGRSDGHASEAALVEDAIYFLDMALQRPDVDPNRVVIHGRSMGGGIAAGVAKARPPRAMILGSTFTSMVDLAPRKALIPGFLVRHTLDVASGVKQAAYPILIFHGTHDNIVPVKYGRRLRDMALNGEYHELNCSHNDFPGPDDVQYWGAIGTFLQTNGVIDVSANDNDRATEEANQS